MSDHKWLTLFNAYWLNIGSKGAEIAYFLLLVAVLDKAELGVFNYLMTISLFFLTLLDFGLSQISLRVFSQREADICTTIKQSSPPRAILLLVTILIIGIGYFLQFISKINAISLILLALYQALNFFHLLLLDAIRGVNRQTAANKIIGLEALLKLALLVSLKWIFNKVHLYEIITALIISKTILLILTTYIVRPFLGGPHTTIRINSKFNPLVFEGQINYLWISLLTVLQNRLDWLMVSMYLDNRAIAAYSVVNRYFEILLFVIGIGFTTLYPWICRAASTKDTSEDNLLRIMRRILFLPVPILVTAAAFFFPYINATFWEGQYSDAASANLLLLPCAGFATANMLVYYDLMANKYERFLISTCLISTLLQAAFNFFAIPALGIHGAIAGMWLMNISNLIIFSFLCFKRLHTKSETASNILIASAISFFLLAGMQLLQPQTLLITVAILTTISTLFLWQKRSSIFKSQADPI